MITTGLWQDATIQGISSRLSSDEDVRALVLMGSGAQAPLQRDYWSDLDLLVVVGDEALDRFYPSVDWLACFGNVFAYNQSADQFKATTRVCFEDFRRVDFAIMTESALARIQDWPSISFWEASHILFSRSALIDRVLSERLARPQPPLISPDQFQSLANDFWFKAMLAVLKVVRNDLLIALHLSLDLVRDCCVLGMLLRDRAEGTSHQVHDPMQFRLVFWPGSSERYSRCHPWVRLMHEVTESAATQRSWSARATRGPT